MDPLIQSPTEFLDSLRADKEDEATRTSIQVKRCLAILDILLTAAKQSADAGNVRMQTALKEIEPLLPQPK